MREADEDELPCELGPGRSGDAALLLESPSCWFAPICCSKGLIRLTEPWFSRLFVADEKVGLLLE